MGSIFILITKRRDQEFGREQKRTNGRYWRKERKVSEHNTQLRHISNTLRVRKMCHH